MKTHTVKSNAKRHAKKLAEKFPDLVVLEPVPVAPGAREWFPAVEWREWSANGKRAIDVPDEIHDTCMLIRPAPLPDLAWPDDFAGKSIDLDPKPVVIGGPRFGKTAVMNEIIEQALDDGRTIAIVSGGDVVEVRGAGVAKDIAPGDSELVTINKPRSVGPSAALLTPAQLATMAAQLPPPVKSTPEEIAARLSARRERMATKALEPVKEAAPKVPRGAIIVELCSRPGGATQAELEEATGWQRHTLRGYIAGTLRKRGHAIVVKKIKGEPTRYIIEGGAA
jgi:hypothetical protein